MDISKTWEAVGQCGAFQIFNYFYLSLPIIYCAMPSLAYLFTAADTDHRCLIPECESATDYTFDAEYLIFTTPRKELLKKSSTVLVFDRDSRFKPIPNASCVPEDFSLTEVLPCDDWVWKPPEHSIAKEWNLIGNQRWKRQLVGTINNAAQFGGYIFAGVISDEFGRKSTIVYCCLASSFLGIIRSFSPNYIFFVAFEFFDLILVVGVYSCCVVLGMEIIGPSMRPLGGALAGIYYALGETLVGVIASQVFYWRTQLRIIYAPATLFFILNCEGKLKKFDENLELPRTSGFLPDSIIWLLSKGRTDEAMDILFKAAKQNRVELTDYVRVSISSLRNVSLTLSHDAFTRRSTFKKFLKSSTLLIRITIACFCWLTNSLVYYGLSLNSVVLGGDKYMNYILVCLIELIGNFIIIFASEKAGRRKLLALALMIAGSGCFLSLAPPDEMFWFSLIFFLMGKVGITISFAIMHIYVNEMFPTPIRNSCHGFCSMIGQVGSVIAPQTPLLAEIWQPLPVLIFGTLAFIAGGISLKLPETKNTKLPDSVAEAEKLGSQEEEAAAAEEEEDEDVDDYGGDDNNDNYNDLNILD